MSCWSDGWVCGTGNLFPKENSTVYDLAKARKTVEAMEAHEKLLWPYLHLFMEPDSNGEILWLQIIKEGLKLRGVDAGYCRKPVTSDLPAETVKRLKDTLKLYGHIG
jgi:4-hydroxy-tetrahydrodipicolinate synthase